MDTHIFSAILLEDAVLNDDFTHLDYATLLCVARSRTGEIDDHQFPVSFCKFRQIMNELEHYDPKVVHRQFEWAKSYCSA